jgi:hypothetical protein
MGDFIESYEIDDFLLFYRGVLLYVLLCFGFNWGTKLKDSFDVEFWSSSKLSWYLNFN